MHADLWIEDMRTFNVEVRPSASHLGMISLDIIEERGRGVPNHLTLFGTPEMLAAIATAIMQQIDDHRILERA